MSSMDAHVSVTPRAAEKAGWRPDRGNVAFLEHSQPHSKRLSVAARLKAEGKTACSDGYERHSWNGTGRCARCDTPLKARGRPVNQVTQ